MFCIHFFFSISISCLSFLKLVFFFGWIVCRNKYLRITFVYQKQNNTKSKPQNKMMK